MPSIKLGQLMSLANRFSGNALSNQQAKAATQYADDNNAKFKLITEKDLGSY